MKRTLSVVIFLVILIVGCKPHNESQGNSDHDQINQPENQILISPGANRIDTVKFIEETVFESNSDVFMEGYIRNVAVDDKERLFIASTRPGLVGIYVFRPDGSYITKLSRHGRGPAEYESINSMSIVGENLYVFDTRLQKIGIFSLDGFKHVKDLLLDHSLLKENEELTIEWMIANKLMVKIDGSFIVRLKSRPRNDPSFQHKEIYFQVDENGKILPSPYVEVNSHTYYFPKGRFDLPFTAPFTRSSLVTINSNGEFYSNWTEDFIISVHDSEGDLEKIYKHNIQNANLKADDLNLDWNMMNTLNKYELPSTWPAVHTMVLDDEERLWVSTITESESEFSWYVVSTEGELLARFTKAGRRTERTATTAPLIVIKDGYFYSHNRDLRQGVDRIVKYKIEFINR